MMNHKKREEKRIKRGLMTNAERLKIRKEKMYLALKRKHGKKYKKPLEKFNHPQQG